MRQHLQSSESQALIQQWQRRVSSETWTSNQVEEITEKLVELSQLLTPHIVNDMAIGNEAIQTFLVSQVNSELCKSSNESGPIRSKAKLQIK